MLVLFCTVLVRDNELKTKKNENQTGLQYIKRRKNLHHNIIIRDDK